MPLIQIMRQALNVPCSKRKEELAEEIAARLLQECPGASLVNTSTLRSFIFDLLDYNKQAEDDTCIRHPYAICKANTFGFPLKDQKLILTATEDNNVLKVCPSCKMTANVGDPICPNCNHVYTLHELEETVVTAAIASLGMSVELSAAKKNEVVLDDAVEGFRVTEGDVDKYMREVEKYRPTI